MRLLFEGGYSYTQRTYMLHLFEGGNCLKCGIHSRAATVRSAVVIQRHTVVTIFLFLLDSSALRFHANYVIYVCTCVSTYVSGDDIQKNPIFIPAALGSSPSHPCCRTGHIYLRMVSRKNLYKFWHKQNINILLQINIQKNLLKFLV